MSDQRAVPLQVAMQVDQYIDRELRDAKSYENRTPLDESGVFSLHCLAAEIYAAGFADGERVEAVRAHAREARERKYGVE